MDHLINTLKGCIGSEVWIRFKSNGNELRMVPAEITNDGYLIAHTIDIIGEGTKEEHTSEVEHNIPLNRIEDVSYEVESD